MSWIIAPIGRGDNLLYSQAGTPSLDLRFASTKSLVDATTGSNLVDFTRASSGTYVGSDGLIKTATTNLLLRSEFQSNWSLFNTASLDPNQALAPDGLTTAALTTSAAAVDYVYSIPTTVIGTDYLFSFYIKAGTSTRSHWHVRSSNTVAFGRINWSDGAIDSLAATVGSASFVDVGAGWYRILVSYTAAETNARHRIGAGDNTSTIGTAYIWGAQLEQSSTVGEYVKTTSTINSAPRFDHDPTTGESLGLLVEESRTNLMTYSEKFDDASWNNSSSLITPNTGSAPDGTATADTLISSVTAVYKTFTSAAQTYTASIFVKQIDGGSVLLQLLGGGAGLNGGVSFDFSTNTASVNGTVTTISSQEFDNGWHRISATLAATGIASPQFRVLVGGGGSCYIWGAQLEAGSFPTSYIPTEGSTVTRAADVASISGSNFSSWYNQSEGTVFAEAAVPVGVSSSRAILSIDDGSNTNRIQIRHNATTARTYLIIDNSSTQFSAQLVGDSFPPGQYVKLAMASKANDFAAVETFGELDTDTSGTMPTVNQLQIGLAPSNAQPCKPIKRITYWPVRLPDATLLNITT